MYSEGAKDAKKIRNVTTNPHFHDIRRDADNFFRVLVFIYLPLETLLLSVAEISPLSLSLASWRCCGGLAGRGLQRGLNVLYKLPGEHLCSTLV